MDSLQLNLPEDVAKSLVKQAADAGMSTHEYVVQLVTESIRTDADEDLLALIESRRDESNDVEDSPEFWANIETRIAASRASTK